VVCLIWWFQLRSIKEVQVNRFGKFSRLVGTSDALKSLIYFSNLIRKFYRHMSHTIFTSTVRCKQTCLRKHISRWVQICLILPHFIFYTIIQLQIWTQQCVFLEEDCGLKYLWRTFNIVSHYNSVAVFYEYTIQCIVENGLVYCTYSHMYEIFIQLEL